MGDLGRHAARPAAQHDDVAGADRQVVFGRRQYFAYEREPAAAGRAQAHLDRPGAEHLFGNRLGCGGVVEVRREVEGAGAHLRPLVRSALGEAGQSAAERIRKRAARRAECPIQAGYGEQRRAAGLGRLAQPRPGGL